MERQAFHAGVESAEATDLVGWLRVFPYFWLRLEPGVEVGGVAALLVGHVPRVEAGGGVVLSHGGTMIAQPHACQAVEETIPSIGQESFLETPTDLRCPRGYAVNVAPARDSMSATIAGTAALKVIVAKTWLTMTSVPLTCTESHIETLASRMPRRIGERSLTKS